MYCRIFATILTLLCLSALSAPARGQSGAEVLFAQGRAALAAGDLETACSRFRDSARLEPRPAPAANLGRCEEQRGHHEVLSCECPSGKIHHRIVLPGQVLGQ